MANGTDLQSYFTQVQTMGSLRTEMHAKRWSTAVLKTLGFNLDGRTKKQLAKALPEELGVDVTRVFWLLHFQDKTLSQQEFLNQVSRRSGNTDWQFAKIPTTAVFRSVKKIIDKDLSDAIADSLSPEVSALWKNA
ncbi:MAG: DUF2267 domain-containing protein [Ardenticatenaceae bacterium]|nr:DUF2267 domain-containing protein [Ardenticatenaceae bacterium]